MKKKYIFAGMKNTSSITIYYQTDGKKIILTTNQDLPEMKESYSELSQKEVFDFLKDPDRKTIYFTGKDTALLFKEIQSYFTYMEAAGGLVRNKKNELLVIYRLGVPDLPKGKAEPGETPAETALREVEEECGISELKIREERESTFHIYCLKGTYVLKHTRWFLMDYSGESSGTPQKEENISSIEWCNGTRLSELQPLTYETLRPFFDASTIE